MQAVPNLGLKEYTGMPIFGEVGPLMIDPEIEKVAYENFDRVSVEFSLKIEGSTLDQQLPYVPCDGEIQIEGNNLTVFAVDENEKKTELIKSQIGCGDYPNVMLLKKSNNIFELFFSEKEKVKCSTKSNKERDIIALSIRLLSGRKLNERSETIQTIQEAKQIFFFF